MKTILGFIGLASAMLMPGLAAADALAPPDTEFEALFESPFDVLGGIEAVDTELQLFVSAEADDVAPLPLFDAPPAQRVTTALASHPVHIPVSDPGAPTLALPPGHPFAPG